MFSWKKIRLEKEIVLAEEKAIIAWLKDIVLKKDKDGFLENKIEIEKSEIDYIKMLQFIDREHLLKSDYERDDEHEQIAIKVYRRLRLRYAQLRELEEQAQAFLVNRDLVDMAAKKNATPNSILPFIGKSSDADNKPIPQASIRAYNLAVTDLFVEKAIAYLEERASDYKKRGHKMMKRSNLITGVGVFLACFQLFFHLDVIKIHLNTFPFGLITVGQKIEEIAPIKPSEKNLLFTKGAQKLEETAPIELAEKNPLFSVTKIKNKNLDLLIEEKPAIQQVSDSTESWVSGFARSFSALGMIVLLAVRMSRYGKAMLDQGERLLERRHALRQGRLFVHLNGGMLNVEEMEEAFNWNVSGSNAFGNIPTESQAPWGVVFKDIIHKAPELLKTGFEAIKKGKKNEN